MTKIRACLLGLGLMGLIGAGQGDQVVVSLATAPPVVVRTTPEAGRDDVDPSLTQISVTYSKDMTDKSWSWSTWGTNTFPQMTGRPHYLADERTCVLPVKLEPRKTYAIWLNSGNFGNFKDTSGNSAVPYLLVFETSAGGGGSPGGSGN
jgi:hypothetical protein